MDKYVYKVIKKPKCIQLEDHRYQFIFKVKTLKAKDYVTLTEYADENDLNRLNMLMNIKKGDLISYLS